MTVSCNMTLICCSGFQSRYF